MKKLLVAATTVGVAVAFSPVAAAEPSWTMPNLVGMDLQGAQDAIQSLTLAGVWFRGWRMWRTRGGRDSARLASWVDQ